RMPPMRIGPRVALDRGEGRARALIWIVENRGGEPVGSLGLERQQAGAETRERVALRAGDRLLPVVVQAREPGAEKSADRGVDDVQEQQRRLAVIAMVVER